MTEDGYLGRQSVVRTLLASNFEVVLPTRAQMHAIQSSPLGEAWEAPTTVRRIASGLRVSFGGVSQIENSRAV